MTVGAEETRKLSDFVTVVIVFALGTLLGLVVMALNPDLSPLFKDNEGTLLTISDIELGTIYNKIENPYFCIIQRDGAESGGKAYLLPDCPSRFSLVIDKDGDYEIVPVPLSPTLEKK